MKNYQCNEQGKTEMQVKWLSFTSNLLNIRASTLGETKGFARPIWGCITEGGNSLKHFHCHQYFRLRDFMRQVQ